MSAAGDAIARDLRPLGEHSAIHALKYVKDYVEANASTSVICFWFTGPVRSQNGRRASPMMAANADWQVEPAVGSDKLIVSRCRRGDHRTSWASFESWPTQIARSFAGGRPLHRLSLLGEGTPRRVRLLWNRVERGMPERSSLRHLGQSPLPDASRIQRNL